MAAAKVITMCHFDRPDYTARAMAALARCDGIADYRVLAHLDVSPHRGLYVDTLAALRSSSVPNLEVTSPASRRGCDASTACALSAGFSAGAGFVIHVEDDILLAPDALRFFEHCDAAYRDDPQVFSVTAYNRERGRPDESRWHELRRREWYHGWGWGTWRDRWEEFRVEIADPAVKGWDTHLHRAVMCRPRFRVEVHPTLSRSQNVGVRSSIHRFTPSWHASEQHVPHWAGDLDVPAGGFRE